MYVQQNSPYKCGSQEDHRQSARKSQQRRKYSDSRNRQSFGENNYWSGTEDPNGRLGVWVPVGTQLQSSRKWNPSQNVRSRKIESVHSCDDALQLAQLTGDWLLQQCRPNTQLNSATWQSQHDEHVGQSEELLVIQVENQASTSQRSIQKGQRLLDQNKNRDQQYCGFSITAKESGSQNR